MPNLREFLVAFSIGQLKLTDIIASVEEKVGDSLESAKDVLFELDNAYQDKILDLNTLEILKRTVITAVTTNISDTPGLDLDLSNPGPVDESTIAAITEFKSDSFSSPIEVSPGMILRDRFLIDELIGIGGMGSVYKGRDKLKLEAQDRNPYIAIKVLNEEIKKRPDAFISLQREASRQQRLAHPNIATVYDFDRINTVVFITMEYLEGTPLDEYIKTNAKKQGGLSLEEGFQIIQGLANALAYAHEHYIIHSDFKPSNCFLRKDGIVKVLDFGIARAVKAPDQEHHTVFDGASLGAMTPAYASFEMLEKNADPDQSDDVYALACVSYELLSGRHPFNKVPANTAAEHHMKPVPIEKLNRNQNKALAHALAFRREDRTLSISQFMEEFGGGELNKRDFGRYAVFAGIIFTLVTAGVISFNEYRVRRIETLIHGLSSGDTVIVHSSIGKLNRLNPEQRLRVLTSAKEPLTKYFENQIILELKAMNFQGAHDTIDRARSLFSDSARIENIAQTVDEEQGRLLGTLGEAYDAALKNRQLLPTQDENNLPAIIEKLKKIDPNHNLITDIRIAYAYSEETERLITQSKLDEAEMMLNTGIKLAPDNIVLINTRDLLQARIEAEVKQAAISQIEQRLVNKADLFITLTAVKPYESDLIELSKLDHDNTLLREIAAQLRPDLTNRITSLQNAAILTQLNEFRNEYSPIMSALDLNSELDSIEGIINETNRQVETLANGIADAIALGDLDVNTNNLIIQLSKLREIAPEDPRGEKFLTQIIKTYINNARNYKLSGQWEQARQQIAFANQLNPSKSLSQQLNLELAEITQAEIDKNSKIASEKLKRDAEQRQNNIIQLEKKITNEVENIESTADARQVLQSLGSLKLLTPNNPLIDTIPRKITEKLAFNALAKGEKTGNWVESLTSIKQAESLFPNAPVLNNARQKIETEIINAENLAMAHQTEQLKIQLQSLMSKAPTPLDDTWTKAIAEIISNLGNLIPENDPWLITARDKIIELYLTEASSLRNTQRFALARRTLDRAELISPGTASINKERSILEQQQKAFSSQQKAKEKIARIESYKQTFEAYITAKDVAKAEKTLTLLSKELQQNDPFITDEAPESIASIYYQFARVSMEQNNFNKALSLSNAGLSYRPKDKQLMELRRGAQIELENLEISELIKKAASLNDPQLKKRVNNLMNNTNDISRIQEGWTNIILQRLKTLKSNDPEGFNILLVSAKELFPGSMELSSVSILNIQKEPPATTALNMQKESTLTTTPNTQKEVPKTLSGDNVFGQWCGDKIKLVLASNEMTFLLQNGTDVSYRIQQYDYSDSHVTVSWTNQNGGNMLIEFGQFSKENNEMVQIRGRDIKSSDWIYYNRPFRRCN